MRILARLQGYDWEIEISKEIENVERPTLNKERERELVIELATAAVSAHGALT